MNRAFPMIFVADVSTTVRFYEQAVGAICDHVHDDGSYAELRVDSLTVGVVQADFAKRHFPGDFRRHQPSDVPAAFEIYIEVDDVDKAVARAIDAGAIQLGEPTERPWRQRNSFVRDPNGVVIELASATEERL